MRQLGKLTKEHEVGDYKGCHCVSECEKPESIGALQTESEDGEPVVNTVPDDYFLADTEDLLDALDPTGDRLNTFYIYNEFSPLLAELRGKKKRI